MGENVIGTCHCPTLHTDCRVRLRRCRCPEMFPGFIYSHILCSRCREYKDMMVQALLYGHPFVTMSWDKKGKK